MEKRRNIVQICPFLAVADIAASIAFYTEVLGFTCYVNEDGYAYLERERAGIRLLAPDGTGPDVRGKTLVYVDVHNLDEIWGEIETKLEALSRDRWSAPKDQPYGIRELMVRDPDGNTLIFAQGIGEFANQWDYRE